jgi:hypothetical protein
MNHIVRAAGALQSCWPLFSLVLLISGCANQNSIFRVADTDSNKTETILIDAKQRPITVNTVTDSKRPMTCLGRSADALSQAAASGNLKINQASGGGGEAGFAMAEQATSIAFRTQVTEAQQEFLYYLCQLRANSSLTDDDVSSNLKHFQNTMLAMVAIDDLADGARFKNATSDNTLGGNTDKPAKPDPSDPKVAKVNQAQTDVDTGKSAVKNAKAKVDSTAAAVDKVTDPKDLTNTTKQLSDALKTYDSKQQAYAKALSNLSAAVKAAKGDAAKVPDDVTSNSSAADGAAKTVKDDYKKLTDALGTLAKVTDAKQLDAPKKDLKAALSDYETAVGKYETSEDALGKAITAWNGDAGAGGSDKKASAKGATDGSSDGGASAAVANDVAIIVQTIVWQSFITEQCQKALFNDYQKLNGRVADFCLYHLYKADEIRERQLAPPSTAGQPGHPTSPPPPASAPPVIPAVVSPPPLFSVQSEAELERVLEEAMKKNAAAKPKAAPPASPPK